MGLISASSRSARAKYTEKEVEKVIKMTEAKKTAKEISAALEDRSENSVRYIQGKLKETEAEDVAAFVAKH